MSIFKKLSIVLYSTDLLHESLTRCANSRPNNSVYCSRLDRH